MYGQPTLTMPPDLIGRAREGVYWQLAAAAEVIVADALTNAPPAPETRRQLKGALALLDLLTGEPGAPLELATAEHGPLLAAAVADMLPKLQLWLDELDDGDERRPERTDELRLLCQFDAHLRRVVGT
jgi:hypothetical protein